MGIDYDAVAGWGIEIKESDVSDDLFDGCDGAYFSDFIEDNIPEGLCLDAGGNHYSDDIKYFIIDRFENTVKDRIEDINKAFGSSFTKDDVKWVCEVCIW